MEGEEKGVKTAERLLADLREGYTDGLRSACLVAARKLHPDAGGAPGEFEKLQRARDVLLGERI